MQPHPHTDSLAFGPPLLAQSQLHFDHRRHGATGGGEHREESIALRVDLSSAMSRQPGADQPMMVGQDTGIGFVADPPKQRGRTLNVGEKEGERFRARSLSEQEHGGESIRTPL
jgi:hypothetical protein